MATPLRPLSILIMDDEEIVHTTLTRHLKSLGHRVDSALEGGAGLEKIEGHPFDLALIDVRMEGMDGLTAMEKARAMRPDLTCVIVTAHRDLEMAIRALRMGAADYLLKPIKLLELEAAVEKASRIRDLRREGTHLRQTIGDTLAVDRIEWDLVGPSDALDRIREQVRLAVQGGCDTVLITGDTGTGKEIVARSIHAGARGPHRPFIAVSCPALPDTLIESEMFGHVKGAFTGATVDRPGYFELADGGTLFLDEVGDLSPSAQAALLRVLETRTFRRVGGAEEGRVDVLVIAATNANLEGFIQKGKFRRDLFYRLNVSPIHVPRLRERPEDILPLAEHFLEIRARGLPDGCPKISAEAKDLLSRYEYPGNVRELRNVIERAALLSGSSGRVEVGHLDLIHGRGPGEAPAPASEKDRIEAVLNQCLWNRREAARRLGIAYSTLRHKIQLYDIGKR
jgi:DNA-binding NtrC family response regulator